MMTTKIILIISLFCNLISAQNNIIKGHFNLDHHLDTLEYQCYRAGEIAIDPTCRIKIKLGNLKKEYTYNVEYVAHPIITNCGRGCILLSDISRDTEYRKEYRYNKTYNTWILTANRIKYNYDKRKNENHMPKNKLGLDGNEY